MKFLTYDNAYDNDELKKFLMKIGKTKDEPNQELMDEVRTWHNEERRPLKYSICGKEVYYISQFELSSSNMFLDRIMRKQDIEFVALGYGGD